MRYFNQEAIVSLHTSVLYSELMKLYKEHDIALHIEGFDLRSKAQLRMSLSIKIIDYLSSGCAVMCILRKNKADMNI